MNIVKSNLATFLGRCTQCMAHQSEFKLNTPDPQFQMMRWTDESSVCDHHTKVMAVTRRRWRHTLKMQVGRGKRFSSWLLFNVGGKRGGRGGGWRDCGVQGSWSTVSAFWSLRWGIRYGGTIDVVRLADVEDAGMGCALVVYREKLGTSKNGDTILDAMLEPSLIISLNMSYPI